jgi:predicted ATP-dependent serine protease
MGSPGAGSSGGGGHECSFKILLIGDSGVGKSSLLVSFVAASHLDADIAPTIGTHAIHRHAHASAALRSTSTPSLAGCPSPYHLAGPASIS